MHRVTIFMPVSRQDYLHQIFAHLEMLECDSKTTNLLVMVDGDASLYVLTRNYVEQSKFAERLCVQFQSKQKIRTYDVLGRRKRISEIHNQAKEYVGECDYVFGIEDDTIFPLDSLKKFLDHYSTFPYTGFVQGVELGRWGVPYVGAWKFDDVYEPTVIKSMMPKTGREEIDSGGFYCYLTKRFSFCNHEYQPYEGNALGPDVNFGAELRQSGFKNYILWDLNCVHKSKGKDLSLSNTSPMSITFSKRKGRWVQSSREFDDNNSSI